MASKRRERDAWLDIQDVIGSASLWPQRIRSLFWTRPLKHWDRIQLAAFAWVNGLNPIILLEWVELRQQTSCTGMRHLRALFDYFREGRYCKSLYSYDTTMRRWHHLDGSIKWFSSNVKVRLNPV